MNRIKKVGVVTGGGDCPGLNAVIQAFTRTAILQHGWTVVGIPDAFGGLLTDSPSVIPLNLETIKGILPQGGTMLGTSNRADPFKFPVLQADGSFLNEDRSEMLLSRLAEYEIDALVMIGGDGTMRIAHRLAQMGLHIVGVPKTIDNDLYGTDITFGHDSACNVAMEAIDRLQTTAYSHHRIIICEVMGRDAGWLALQSGISGGAAIILLPEVPYHIDNLVKVLEDRSQQGQTSSIIVVAEGASEIDGDVETQGEGHDAPRYGGIAYRLESQLNQRIQYQEVRSVVLGHLQRGGSPTHFDRVLGSRYGDFAAEMVATEQFSHMAALQNDHVVAISLTEATQQIKLINPKTSQCIKAARNLGISFGD